MAEEYILEMNHIVKAFSGVRALDDVNFKVKRGEIMAICGENGAGKSTLMNVLSGVYPYGTYEGDIVYCGEVCKFHSIKDSERKGIVIIHQELALSPYLSVAENVFIGNERASGGVIDWTRTRREAQELLERVGLGSENVNVPVNTLGVGKQQMIEIAKALGKKADLLILDEPTAALNDAESAQLLELMLQLKAQGMTCIIISHKLNEISYVADSVTIIRDGHTIETLQKGVDEFSEERIIKGMVGRSMEDRYPAREHNVQDEVNLEVKNWTVHHPLYPERVVDDNISFHIRRGEVVGFSGLQGAGRTELAMSIFGRSYGTGISGELYIGGQKVDLRSPQDAIHHRLAYVTEDRKTNGLILDESIRFNTTLARLDKVCKGSIIDTDQEVQVAEQMTRDMGTKTPTIEQNVGNLSGGNQQKALLGKWMFTEPDILIMDEPTRGIDVGAKYEIYCLINQMVAQGKSVMMISSELPELLGMCDRIYVMNEGRLLAEVDARDATQESIMGYIIRDTAKA